MSRKPLGRETDVDAAGVVRQTAPVKREEGRLRIAVTEDDVLAHSARAGRRTAAGVDRRGSTAALDDGHGSTAVLADRHASAAALVDRRGSAVAVVDRCGSAAALVDR